MKFLKNAYVIILMSLLVPTAANATLIQANTISTNMGAINPSFLIQDVINPNGLSALYVSGLTDFDSYVAGTTHSVAFEQWISSENIVTGIISFDFGGNVSLNAMALWNSSWGGSGGAIAVNQFELLFDNDNNFGNGVIGSLGVFNATNTNNPHPSEVFNFASTSLQFLHMNIQSNHGAISYSGFADVVFRSTDMPEPTSLALFGLSLFGLVFFRKRKV
ncbi:PEP-CTERM sorting domain-containing protein [Colwellia psychrerythraea]|uniref:PEP motif putative anchor domain protein n=1 Tax=Colwellia psychrerythraea TaxID=28229 RepID=A0A099KFI1_COLPS|nr:PEP-CTERM sorting domain-containing protein [Colwellia psychrerythraea]KGJ89524.1 PEP motif putative anchor domain protein [Colwellia psychrerythraea]